MEKQDGKFVAMVTKDFQTVNLKFEQVMFNSLSVLESYLYLSVLKLVMIKNVKLL